MHESGSMQHGRAAERGRWLAAGDRDVQAGDGTCGGGERVLAGEELERGRRGRAAQGGDCELWEE
jgi:hypothetical protein